MCAKCAKGLATDQYLIMLTDLVARHGWAVQGLTDGSLFYTVGLTLRGLPELVLTDEAGGAGEGAGSAGHLAAAVLNELARRQVAAGAFEPGQLTEVRGQRVRVAEQDVEPLVLARKLYGRHHDLAALRVDPWVLGR